MGPEATAIAFTYNTLSACAIRVTCCRRKIKGLDLFAKSIADSLVEAIPVTPPRS